MKDVNKKQLKALVALDLSRTWKWLSVWWGFCLLQAGFGVALCYGFIDVKYWSLGWEYLVSFIFIVALVGSLLRPCQPRVKNSFLSGRAISAGALLKSRILLIFLLVLAPLFLTRLLPLILVESGPEPILVYSVCFWGLYLGLVALVGVLAVGSRTYPSYLFKVVLLGALLALIAELSRNFSFRESNWIAVTWPVGAAILWQVGLALLGAVVFSIALWKIYQGGDVVRMQIATVVFAMVLAASWKVVQFNEDWRNMRQPISNEDVNLSEIQFKFGRRVNGYSAQVNGKPGHYTVDFRSTPPYHRSGEEAYWNNSEHFWFVEGRLEVEGLAPELVVSARLLEARWTAPDGEVLKYQPPEGTYSVTGKGGRLAPPGPTEAGLDLLLGARPENALTLIDNGEAGTLLFGAWTSAYERFKTSSGRLEMKFQIDFFAHELAAEIPVDSVGSRGASPTSPRLTQFQFEGEKVEARVTSIQAGPRWQTSSQSHSNPLMLLHHKQTGWREPSSGGGSGSYPALGSLNCFYSSKRFYITERLTRGHLALPEVQDSLQLVEIRPRYLGSTDIEMTVDDFALVTEDELESIRRREGELK